MHPGLGEPAHGGDVKRRTRILACLFLGVDVSSADAATIFVGIGNDEFKGELENVVKTMQPYATLVTATNQDQGILTELATGAGKLSNDSPDVLIFFYRGHGGTRDDRNNKDEKADFIIGTSPAGKPPFPNNPVTDDQLTAAFKKINTDFPKAAVVAVLDSCEAGWAVKDRTDLASVTGVVVGAAQADQCASGNGTLAVFDAAFQVNKGFFQADSDKDGKLTVGELLGFMRSSYAFYKDDDKGTPFFLDFGKTNLSAVVATKPVPEPSMLPVLVAIGLAAAFKALSRGFIPNRRRPLFANSREEFQSHVGQQS
jgi:hypothetical protein